MSIETIFVDYHSAVFRIAVLETRTERHLICAIAELLPAEIPAPPEGQWEYTGLFDQPETDLHVLFRRMVVTVSDAVSWLRSAEQNTDDDLPLPLAAGAEPVRVPKFGAETRSDRFVLLQDCPFSADWHDNPRVARLVPMVEPPATFEALKSSKSAREWLLNRLGFDLFPNPQWLQVIAIIAPNPLVRQIRERLLVSHPNGSEVVLIRFEPRTGASLNGLSLITREERVEGLAMVDVRQVSATGIELVHLPEAAWKIGFTLFDRDRGPLAVSEPAPFIRSINVRVQVFTPSTHQLTAMPKARTTEDISSQTTRERLLALRARAEQQSKPSEQGQFWFTEPSIARAHLRAEILKTQRRLWLIDYDIPPHEAMTLLSEIASQGKDLRILVADPDSRIKIDLDMTSSSTERLQLPLPETWERVRIRSTRTRETRMGGKYIVRDEKIFILTESVNILGQLPGGIFLCPDPEPVIVAIEQAWDDARQISIAELIEFKPDYDLPGLDATESPEE